MTGCENCYEDYADLKRLDAAKAVLYSHYAKRHYVAYLMTVFGGFFGLQWFYFNKPVAGIVSVIFSFTFIPVLVSIIFLFFIHSKVDQHNLALLEKLLAN